MERTLLVVAKKPTAGQTKTRLCPPLDAVTAAGLYACFLRDTLEIMRRVPGVRREVVYFPAAAADYFHDLAPDMGLSLQHGADLGERLDNLLTAALAAGAAQAVVIGSDSPTLPAAYVARAFTLLDDHDVVLGPSDDGGYYLIGLCSPQPRVLRDVTMSTPHVFRDTLAVTANLGLRVALLPTWYDVDTAAELARLREEVREAPPDVAPHTRRFLEQLPAL
jgi:hypothetical protein